MADDDYLVFSHTSSIGNKPHCNAAHPTSWQQLLLLVLAFFAPWNWSIWAPAQRYTIKKYISCHTCNGFAWPFKKGVDSCFKENIIMMWIFFFQFFWVSITLEKPEIRDSDWCGYLSARSADTEKDEEGCCHTAGYPPFPTELFLKRSKALENWFNWHGTTFPLALIAINVEEESEMHRCQGPGTSNWTSTCRQRCETTKYRVKKANSPSGRSRMRPHVLALLLGHHIRRNIPTQSKKSKGPSEGCPAGADPRMIPLQELWGCVWVQPWCAALTLCLKHVWRGPWKQAVYSHGVTQHPMHS